jgi:hypothetical protein
MKRVGLVLVLALGILAGPAFSPVVYAQGPYAAQVQAAIRSLTSGGTTFTTLKGVAASTVLIPLTAPTNVAATPSQLGTDLAAGVYTITVVAYDYSASMSALTLPATSTTCTITAGGKGRCAVSWTAVDGAAGYVLWSSVADNATPTLYWVVEDATSVNLDSLSEGTALALPTTANAYVVKIAVGGWWLPGFSRTTSEGAWYSTLVSDRLTVSSPTDQTLSTITAYAAVKTAGQLFEGAVGETTVFSVDYAGIVSGTGYYVGAVPGIDKTCGGPVVSATFTKGILTAMSCTSEPNPEPLPTYAELVAEVRQLRTYLAGGGQ